MFAVQIGSSLCLEESQLNLCHDEISYQTLSKSTDRGFSAPQKSLNSYFIRLSINLLKSKFSMLLK